MDLAEEGSGSPLERLSHIADAACIALLETEDEIV
jgi:hypothetical protein